MKALAAFAARPHALVSVEPSIQKFQPGQRLRRRDVVIQARHVMPRPSSWLDERFEMRLEMFQVVVYCDGGSVFISQDKHGGEVADQVELRPEQIPFLCQWLTEAAHAQLAAGDMNQTNSTQG